MKQKILMIATVGPSLRCEAESWGGEDGNVVHMEKPVGLSPGLQGFYCYKTPLHAMGDGWRLMGPPIEEKYGDTTTTYEWWFEK